MDKVQNNTIFQNGCYSFTEPHLYTYSYKKNEMLILIVFVFLALLYILDLL